MHVLWVGPAFIVFFSNEERRVTVDYLLISYRQAAFELINITDVRQEG